MSNSINTLQCNNQLLGFESNRPVQHKDIINLIENELIKLDNRTPGYSINNMPDELKEKVLEKYRYFNVEHDWYDYLIHYWIEQLKIYGFDNVKINFNNVASARNSVSFTANVDLKIYLKAHKLGNKYRATLSAAKGDLVNLKVYRICPQYPHGYIISTRSEYFGNNTTVREQLDELNEQILKKARCLSREIYRNLENEHNYLISNESLLETLEANDYAFKSNGEIFGYC